MRLSITYTRRILSGRSGGALLWQQPARRGVSLCCVFRRPARPGARPRGADQEAHWPWRGRRGRPHRCESNLRRRRKHGWRKPGGGHGRRGAWRRRRRRWKGSPRAWRRPTACSPRRPAGSRSCFRGCPPPASATTGAGASWSGTAPSSAVRPGKRPRALGLGGRVPARRVPRSGRGRRGGPGGRGTGRDRGDAPASGRFAGAPAMQLFPAARAGRRGHGRDQRGHRHQRTAAGRGSPAGERRAPARALQHDVAAGPVVRGQDGRAARNRLHPVRAARPASWPARWARITGSSRPCRPTSGVAPDVSFSAEAGPGRAALALYGADGRGASAWAARSG